MTDTQRLANIIVNLEKAQPITPDACARMLGLTWGNVDESDKPSFITRTAKVDAGPAAGLIASVELRIPSKGGPFLLLRLPDNAKVDANELLLQFPDHREEPPSPTAPPTVPDPVFVDRPWGQLIFGIARQGPRRLISVAFDAK